MGEKKKELDDTRSKLIFTRKKAIELLTDICKAPIRPKILLTSSIQRHRLHVRSKPTPSSGITASYLLGHHQYMGTLDNIPLLDQKSLKICHGGVECEVGSGTFGKCTKMFLSGTEVAVKTTTLKQYTHNNILHEAKVMAAVCRGHPNLPWSV